MLLLETSLFYLVIGVGVAAAVYLHERERAGIELAGQAALACLFWPLYVPVLLAERPAETGQSENLPLPDENNDDEFDPVILQVERELNAALGSLEGWAADIGASNQE